MKCKKAEALIALYSTHTPAEQTQLEKHLENCSSCTAVFEQFQKQQEVLARLNNWSQEIKDPVLFTDQIMEALPIQTFQLTKKENSLLVLFNRTFLQTGLAACSLVLILTFVIEFNRSAVSIQKPTVKNGSTLTTDLEKLIQAKRTRTARFSLKIIQRENTFALSK